MSEPTRTPWYATTTDFRGDEHPHNYYIHGDLSESFVEDEETGEELEDGTSCVAVAVVMGNATAGDIPRLNAELIVQAVNSHADLLATAKALLAIVEADYGHGVDNGYFPTVAPVLRAAREVVAKAEGGR